MSLTKSLMGLPASCGIRVTERHHQSHPTEHHSRVPFVFSGEEADGDSRLEDVQTGGFLKSRQTGFKVF